MNLNTFEWGVPFRFDMGEDLTGFNTHIFVFRKPNGTTTNKVPSVGTVPAAGIEYLSGQPIEMAANQYLQWQIEANFFNVAGGWAVRVQSEIPGVKLLKSNWKSFTIND